MSTVIVLLVIIVLSIYSIKVYMKKLRSGCCGSSDVVKKIKPQDKNINNYKYHYIIDISMMTCSNCQRRIENYFNELEGCYMIVDLPHEKGELYSKSQLINKDIENMFRQLGYGAKVR